MPQNDGTLTVEDARILFRNFAGKEGMYNREGDRNFCLLLEPDLAAEMQKDGWNIKTLRAREEGDEPQPYIQVSVSYKNRPPRIMIITSRGRTPIAEDMVEMLDWVDIKSVDMIIRPYHWNVSGKTGIKAYMQSIYITILEDALEQKYADVPYAELEGNGTAELESGSGPLELNRGSEEYDETNDIVDAEVVED